MKTLKQTIGGLAVVSSLLFGGIVAHAETKEVMVSYESEEGKKFALEISQKVETDLKHVGALLVKADEKDIKTLKEHPGIESVSEDKTVKLIEPVIKATKSEVIASSFADEVSKWHLLYSNIQSAWNKGYTGKGVKVAVLDTGIASHLDLKVTKGVSFVNGEPSYDDLNGHGTHVAGIIGAKRNGYGTVGMAPDSQLYAVKVLNKEGQGSLFDIVKGINWAIEQDVDIINLSLSSVGSIPEYEQAIQKAYENDILIVAAAGNNGQQNNGETSTVLYPGAYPKVIAVSAIDSFGDIAWFSSAGKKVEIAGTGDEVYSTYLGNQFVWSSGTSMASPSVAGLLAVLKEQYPSYTNDELRLALQQNVVDRGAYGRDNLYGYGAIKYEASSNAVLYSPYTNEPITKIENDAKRALQLLESSKTKSNYAYAKSIIKTAPNIKAMKSYQERLEVIRSESFLPAKRALDTIQKATTATNYQSLSQATNNLIDADDQKDFTASLKMYESIFEFRANISINQVKRHYTNTTVNNARKAISEVPNSSSRAKLQAKLNTIIASK